MRIDYKCHSLAFPLGGKWRGYKDTEVSSIGLPGSVNPRVGNVPPPPMTHSKREVVSSLDGVLSSMRSPCHKVISNSHSNLTTGSFVCAHFAEGNVEECTPLWEGAGESSSENKAHTCHPKGPSRNQTELPREASDSPRPNPQPWH